MTIETKVRFTHLVKLKSMEKLEAATLAGGCFWCTEAIFKRLKGVSLVIPGYSGGDEENPSYDQVSSGDSGHAEAIQIKFDPQLITYEKLLEVFFKTHDPTTLNKQGNDVGEQYRSEIFYHDEGQKEIAKKLIKKLNEEDYQGKIVTQLSPYKNFFEAEDYHKEYYEKNRSAGYCQVVIDPKIQRLNKEFSKEIK